jgi:hypothetical protein
MGRTRESVLAPFRLSSQPRAICIWMAAALAAFGLPSVALSASSPVTLLAKILATARAQRSVHYVSTAHLGTIRVVQVADVAATKGIQRITFTNANATGRVTVIVSGKSAYIRGDSFVLVNYMGFKRAASAKYANRWVSIPRGDRAFSSVAADVTLPSTIDSLVGRGRPTAAPSTTVDGQRVVGVQWRARVGGKPVSVRLYARASRTPLPVEQRATRGTATISVMFSRWNETVPVTAPKSAVPIAGTGLE